MEKLTCHKFKINDTYTIIRIKILGNNFFNGWYNYYLQNKFYPNLQYLYGIEEKVSQDYLIKYFNANFSHLKDFYK